MNYIFRARNLFSVVIARLPENMDARLGRTLINMNLPRANGRPDNVIKEDVDVFLKGYDLLPAGLSGNEYFYLALQEIAWLSAWFLRTVKQTDAKRRRRFFIKSIRPHFQNDFSRFTAI